MMWLRNIYLMCNLLFNAKKTGVRKVGTIQFKESISEFGKSPSFI